MKIFYHNDMDGRCAAHLVFVHDDDAREHAEAIAMAYGVDFPFDRIEDDEVVYILDFSIEPEDMVRLLDITRHVIWIDHHKTALEKYEDMDWAAATDGRLRSAEDIMGLRRHGTAGCELTYEYFHATLARPVRPVDTPPTSVQVGEHRYNIPELTPAYILLIGDRDTWTWKYGDKTKYFHAGLQVADTDPMSTEWATIWTHPDWYIQDGKTIQRYKDLTEQAYAREHGFWVEFGGYKCYAVNGGKGSEAMQAVAPDADVWIAFSYMPQGFWTVSLYSTKPEIDVGAIASRYEYHGNRGGGCPGAAGFECLYPPFLPELIKEINK